jgi:hypothetical protein
MSSHTRVVALLWALWMASAAAQPPAVAIATLGPQPGSPVPPFTAVDQHGRTHTLQSLLGPKGAMLVFSRSADW